MKKTPRSSVPAVGSFVSIPGAFKGADAGLRHIVKMQFETRLSKLNSDRLETVFSPDVILVDVGAMNLKSLDTSKIAKDCELIARVVRRHPKKLRELAEVFQPATRKGRKELLRAFRTLKELGLTESATARAGGGILFLLAVVALAGLASGCAHCSNRRPPQHPR